MRNTTVTILKLLAFLLFCFDLYLSHKPTRRCGQIKRSNKEDRYYDISSEGSDENLRFLQTTWQPIRFYIDYYMLDTQIKTYGADFIANIKLVVNKSVEVFQSLLQVKRSTSLLKVDICDETVLLSDTVRKTGVDADIIIIPMIASDESDSSSGLATEGYAYPCGYDSLTKRPIIGVMAYTNITDFSKSNAYNYYNYLTLHEMSHILFMNYDLFDKFIDANGKKLGINNVILNTSINNVSRLMIKTPKVLETARKHFNCQSLQGVELEDQGGDGTSKSHWESRVLLGDYMVGQSGVENSISEISLALAEDSGWYKVNYYTGGLFRYGKNEGCSFLNQKCITTSEKTNFLNEFCLVSNVQMCTAGRLSKGYCSLSADNTDVPKDYQYFTASAEKAGFSLADFCPVAMLTTKTDNYFLPEDCSTGVSSLPKILGEKISSNSYCYISSLYPKNSEINSNDRYAKGNSYSICYETVCDTNKHSIRLNDSNSTIIECPRAGGTVTSSNYSGSVNCPDYNLLCTKTAECSEMVECALKKVTRKDYTYDYTSVSGQDLTKSLSYDLSDSSSSLYNDSGNKGSSLSTTSAKNSSCFINLNLASFYLFLFLCSVLLFI